MSKNIIKLSEEYGIGSDEFNIILYQRKVNNKEHSKNYGNEYYSAIGYYSSIEAVLRALINRQVQLNLSEQTTLESLVNSVETYVQLLSKNVEQLVKGN